MTFIDLKALSPNLPSFAIDAKAQFGAPGIITADSTAQLQAAFNALPPSGGAVLLAPGVYNVSQTLTIPRQPFALIGYPYLSYVNEVPNSARIRLANGANVDILNTTVGSDVLIENVQFDGNKANNASGRGIVIASIRSKLSNVMVNNCPNDGIFANAGNIAFENVYAYVNGGNGIEFSTASTDCQLTNVNCGSNAGSSLVFSGNAADIMITNGNFFNAGNEGVIIQNGATTIKFVNCQINGNQKSGVSLYGSSGNVASIRFISCRIYGNSLIGAGTWPNLLISTSATFTVQDVDAFGCLFGDPFVNDNAAGSVQLAQSGTGFIRRMKFLGNSMFSGGASQVVRSGTIDPTVKFNYNDGYITENNGSSTGTGAQQTIAHGLSFTPTQQQIALIAGSATAAPFHSAAPNATNIFVTAANLQPWYWSTTGS